ncbi:MAG TPA: hypothetical protein DCZ12_17550 [Gammaproteobacteria bacterium]|nr:hypothetical protein [Gammaproteobacteria bacterium]
MSSEVAETEVAESEDQLDEAVNLAQEQAEFDAAFAGETLPAKAEEQAAEDEASPDAPEAAEDEPDLEAQMLAKLEEKFATRLRNIEGNLGGLKSQLISIKEKPAPSGRDESVDARQAALDKIMSGQKMQELKEFLPETYDAIAEAFQAIGVAGGASDVDAILNERLAEMQKQNQALTSEVAHEARQKAQLDVMFPGWEDDVQTQEYRDWLALQPPEFIDKAVHSTKVSDAAEILAAWQEKKEASRPDLTAQRRQKKQANLARSIAPTKGSKTPAPAAQLTEHEEFLAAFNGN